MMKLNNVKQNIAFALDITKINAFFLKSLNIKQKNNYIRIINYHEISESGKFEEHLKWYKRTYDNCNYKMLSAFLQEKYVFTKKPGLMITFDDGFDNNYTIAKAKLERYGFTGWFFVSSRLIDQVGYMTRANLIHLLQCDHVIGCHTYSHHRMNVKDTNEILKKEIQTSKEYLEDMLGIPISIFCWVGGEIDTYTNNAQKVIEKSGYSYSMMTHSNPVTPDTNPLYLQRTNIQDYWPIEIVKFQVSGIMDFFYAKRRKMTEDFLKSK